MQAVGSVLVLLWMAAVVIGIITLIRGHMDWLRLRNRKSAAMFLIAAQALLVIGAVVMPKTSTPAAALAPSTSSAPAPTSPLATTTPAPTTTQPPQPPATPASTPVEVTTTIPPLTAAAPTSGHTITYEVVSDGSLSSVTYFDQLSAEKQDVDVPAPWSKTVVNTATYPIAGLGAQTNGTSVTCRITVDGVVADEKTSTGQYAVVDCNASVN